MEQERAVSQTGLTSAKAQELLLQYGRNELNPQKKESLIRKAVHIVAEPMFLLLLLAAVIYFLLGEPGDGAVMMIFVSVMIAIDAAQEWKTDRTLEALKELSAPEITVIRDGRNQEISSAELVSGDLMVICEGTRIPADGAILSCHDFCVDESSLTGEAEPVWKHEARTKGGTEAEAGYWRRDYCYAGTLAVCGSACVLVEKTGAATEYGRIGVRVAEAETERTPLQEQTKRLVTVCAGIAAVLFLLVAAFTYSGLAEWPAKKRLIQSILSGVTLAMAMIPEEFPVILTVFLSMGAWRLAKKNSLVRRLPSVETLGAVSVLCVDKTGTITTNQMEVKELWTGGEKEERLIECMGLACETDAYDPMELAMAECCEKSGYSKERLYQGRLITEYAFTHESRMMGHVWEREGGRIIAVKGACEAVLSCCRLSEQEQIPIKEKAAGMAARGLRVIAVAEQELEEGEEIPESIYGCRLSFCGLAGLFDPPREGIREDILLCRQAGIRVVMITGDSGLTAAAVAEQAGIIGEEDGREAIRKDGEGNMPGAITEIMTGEMVDRMDGEELKEAVRTVSIFSRVIPEHKMRIVRALRESGEIVAMTGDGVNDAPALKYADIGIAMGKRGSEVAREAADLILMDDNFHTIVETVRDGRRIYDNIKKAVGYVFTIHLPIACAALFASILRIPTDGLLFLPIHIVLMELMIDPTCSVVLERQPAESCVMRRKPRSREEKLLNPVLLEKSILQGLALTAASFGSYYLTLMGGSGAETARSMGLTIVILGNLFLVPVNCSECDSAWASMKMLARDSVMRLTAFVTIAFLAAGLYSPLNAFLNLAPLSWARLLAAAATAAAAVFWYEGWKAYRRRSL